MTRKAPRDAVKQGDAKENDLFNQLFGGTEAAPLPPAAQPAAKEKLPAAAPSVWEAKSPPIAASPQPGTMDSYLRDMMTRRASDVHLSVGQPVIFRIDGEITRLSDSPLDQQGFAALVDPLLNDEQRQRYREKFDIDFAYALADLARFRVNLFTTIHGRAAVFRHIPSVIPTLAQLNLPQAIVNLCQLAKGLILVTGPTGSGKSTTLAAMIDQINATRSEHIITIEDPVEFVHPPKKCLVNQREVGKHTLTFATALRAALREDPDIVLIGELRDLETTAMAIETAETGHVVFATLHTNSAVSSVDRIIDQFPSAQQGIIRSMLAANLRGVISQTLCRKEGGGRVGVYEILIPNDAVAAMIREGKNHMIQNHMMTQKVDGNILLNEALINLVKSGKVNYWEAWRKAIDKKDFELLAQRAKLVIPRQK